MKVVEKFISINGEGTKAGELAIFIRFKGCNLNCAYCDTKWANKADCPYEEMTVWQICDYILETGIENVTLTGGEPLLQKDMTLLLKELGSMPYVNVEIETNGAVDLQAFIGDYRPAFTMDYKLSFSGCEDKMLLSNMNLLQKEDTVKFVVGSRVDLDRAKYIIEKYDLLNQCHVYFSPVFGEIEPKEIVEYMMEHKMNKVRFQLQMHKFIWDPDKRGV